MELEPGMVCVSEFNLHNRDQARLNVDKYSIRLAPTLTVLIGVSISNPGGGDIPSRVYIEEVLLNFVLIKNALSSDPSFVLRGPNEWWWPRGNSGIEDLLRSVIAISLRGPVRLVHP